KGRDRLDGLPPCTTLCRVVVRGFFGGSPLREIRRARRHPPGVCLSSASVPLSAIVPSLGAVLGCILVGALYATADAAVRSIPEARLRALLGNDDERTALQRYAAQPDTVLARLLLGRVVCIVGASVLAAASLDHVYPRYGALLALLFVAFAYTAV